MVLADFDFADRYAEAGLSPTAEVITNRQAPAQRIVDDATDSRILDLVGAYYGSSGLDLAWLRAEFAQEDASFSLVNNERETRVLAACVLGALVANGNSIAILAVLVGYVGGHRKPSEALWLVRDAQEALNVRSVAERQPSTVETKVTNTATAKLADEITALPGNDWPALLTTLGKMRTEAQSSDRTIAAQTSAALRALDVQMRYLREETQMLWWLTGGHSKSLARSFAAFGPHQAALVGAIDLGELTTASEIGPVAAPAMIERIVAMGKKPKGPAVLDLASAVDGIAVEDLRVLNLPEGKLPPRLAPVSAALELARTIGTGVWYARFRELTGLEATLSIEPVSLGAQLYHEHLLGQLL